MLNMFEASEYLNKETLDYFNRLNQPQKQLPVKIAYQKFKDGKAVLTLLTRD